MDRRAELQPETSILPVDVFVRMFLKGLVRLNSKLVFRGDPAPRPAGRTGRPARHGHRLSLDTPDQQPPPDAELTATSERHGKVRVRAWHTMHQELTRSGHWADWPPDADIPIVRGTVIQISVEHLPCGRKPHRDVWLFHSAPPGAAFDLDLVWKAYLRRFDQEHFHRFAKVYLGLRAAYLASAEATDRWVQLALAAYAALRSTPDFVLDHLPIATINDSVL